MTTTLDNKTTAWLNDRFREATTTADPIGQAFGKKLLTVGIRALPMADQVAIAEKVAAFDTFTEDNDPHGEHDFGSFEHNGTRIFWKIDYYDRASFATDEPFGSEDPDNPAVTLRVLTVMLAEEY